MGTMPYKHRKSIESFASVPSLVSSNSASPEPQDDFDYGPYMANVPQISIGKNYRRKNSYRKNNRSQRGYKFNNHRRGSYRQKRTFSQQRSRQDISKVMEEYRKYRAEREAKKLCNSNTLQVPLSNDQNAIVQEIRKFFDPQRDVMDSPEGRDSKVCAILGNLDELVDAFRLSANWADMDDDLDIRFSVSL